MELVDLMEDMNIAEIQKEEANLEEGEADGIDDLISKMDKVTIEKN